VRPRADTAEFDYFHPGKGSGVAHGSNLTQLSILTFGIRDMHESAIRQALAIACEVTV